MNSSKKWTNEFVFTPMRHVFVHFLEEIEDTKKTFWNYLTFTCFRFVHSWIMNGKLRPFCLSFNTSLYKPLRISEWLFFASFTNFAVRKIIYLFTYKLLPLFVNNRNLLMHICIWFDASHIIKLLRLRDHSFLCIFDPTPIFAYFLQWIK